MRVERVAWCDDAQRGLSETLGSDAGVIRQQVHEGRAELWKLDNGTSWMVTRVEGSELVVMCFQGRDLRRWMRVLYAHAKSQRLKTARFHTRRPAIARLCPFPVIDAEYVFRVKVV